MSASSQKMLSKNRSKEKKKEKHYILTFISHLAEVKRENNFGVAITLEASSKRKMEGITMCVYRTVLVE